MIYLVSIDGKINEYNENGLEVEKIFEIYEECVVWTHFQNTIHENG